MIAPPPIPNRPARKPATTPPVTMAAPSQASSLSGTPENIRMSWGKPAASSRDVRQIRPRVHHETYRLAQDRNAGAGLDGFGGDMTAERARARHAVKHPEDMASHGMQPRAARK